MIFTSPPSRPPPACPQASAGVGQASSQQQYGLTASEQLKAEGNRLHGAKQYNEAADKYRRAISNLTGEAAVAGMVLLLLGEGVPGAKRCCCA